MNKYVNPSCKVISQLPRRSLQIMSEWEEEVRTKSPFGGSVASVDRELAIDGGVPESSVVPKLQFVPDSNVVIQEGEESGGTHHHINIRTYQHKYHKSTSYQ